MSVSEVTLTSETQLTFTVANLPTSDPCEALFLGSLSSSCTAVSDTSSVTATFDMGVPTTSEDTTPQLRFLASDGSTHYAVFEESAVV